MTMSCARSLFYKSLRIKLLFVLNLTMTKASVVKSRRIMMILSPAKTLDLSTLTRSSLPPNTLPDCDPEKTTQIAKLMKKRNESEIKNLLGVSAALAKTSFGYWESFDYQHPRTAQHNTKPSIFCFSGAAYQGIDIEKRSDSALRYLQECLRIIDPLYGVLRPMDLMQPYRLEMATKKVLEDPSIKLSEFWKESVTQKLSEELKCHDSPVLLNLASDEYAAAVDAEKLQAQFVKVVFLDQGRVIGVHAKRARGLMCKYMAENSVNTLDDVKKFDEEGYKFVPTKSDEYSLVFDRATKPQTGKRSATPPKPKSKRTKK